MIDEQQTRYGDLIECSARVLAFDGLIDAALPALVSALTSEAIDLRNGWAEFSPNNEAREVTLPIVDAVIAEVFARATALRREIFGAMRSTGEALAQMKAVDTKHQTVSEIARRMREHLVSLRKQRPRIQVGSLT
jgi:hypothetical protein